MKVIGLDGREHTWNLSQYTKQRRSVSEPHKRLRALLTALFPCDKVLEEVSLPGSGKLPLHADFYVNSMKLMFEVHGEQHYTFNSFHYKTEAEFRQAKARDRQKASWCELNDITLIVLDHKDTEDEWREQILKGQTERVREDS